MHVPQELMGGGDLLAVLVRVVLLQERQAVHVAAAQPLAVVPVAQTLPLAWETDELVKGRVRGVSVCTYDFHSPGGSLQM